MAGPGGDLNVDQSTVETEASNVSGAAGHFSAESLASEDGTSTISANNISKTAFGAAEQLSASLGAAMDQEAANIRGLGVSFMEFDDAMSKLNQQG